ncbi:MAG: hypothetical protein ACKO4S_16985 [Snowella sp.]
MSEVSSTDVSPQQSEQVNTSLESPGMTNPWLADLTESLSCSEPLTSLFSLQQYPKPIALQILALVRFVGCVNFDTKHCLCHKVSVG